MHLSAKMKALQCKGFNHILHLAQKRTEPKPQLQHGAWTCRRQAKAREIQEQISYMKGSQCLVNYSCIHKQSQAIAKLINNADLVRCGLGSQNASTFAQLPGFKDIETYLVGIMMKREWRASNYRKQNARYTPHAKVTLISYLMCEM